MNIFLFLYENIHKGNALEASCQGNFSEIFVKK